MPAYCPTCCRQLTTTRQQAARLEAYLATQPEGAFTALTLARALNLNGPDKQMYRVIQTLIDRGTLRRVSYGLYINGANHA